MLKSSHARKFYVYIIFCWNEAHTHSLMTFYRCNGFVVYCKTERCKKLIKNPCKEDLIVRLYSQQNQLAKSDKDDYVKSDRLLFTYFPSALSSQESSVIKFGNAMH